MMKLSAPIAAAALLLAALLALAGKEQFSLGTGYSTGNQGVRVAQQRRPGSEPRFQAPPTIDPDAVPPPDPNLPNEFIPIPDRWRLIEAIGVNEKWWDPYNQNTLKGDRPLFDDWFVNIVVISDTIYEPRTFPIPVGVQTTKNAGALDTFGDSETRVFNTNLITSLQFIKGNTAYKPPDYEIRITPVFNYNHVEAEEFRVLRVQPERGDERSDRFIGWQELFLDKHLRNVSNRYDFDSIRVGIQPFSTDFRG